MLIPDDRRARGWVSSICQNARKRWLAEPERSCQRPVTNGFIPEFVQEYAKGDRSEVDRFTRKEDKAFLHAVCKVIEIADDACTGPSSYVRRLTFSDGKVVESGHEGRSRRGGIAAHEERP
jgi:hypothetical protein